MKKLEKDGQKKPYRQPEIHSQKLTLGVYGQYGDADAGTPNPVRDGDHLRWNGN